MGRITGRLALTAVLVATMLLTGCITSDNDVDRIEPGDLVTEDESTDLGTAEKVEVYLRQGSGTMEVSSGAAKLMEATFRYNVDQWKPGITYKERGTVWNLSVIQPNTDLRVATGAINEWDVTFGNDVPIDMVVIMGAGDVEMDVGDLDLVDLDVNLGSGDLDLDIGAYDGDNLTVSINCGAGATKIKVPGNMGVRIVPLLGVGSVKATGFTPVGNEYHNGVYDLDQPHIIIHANLGVGDLTITEA